MLCCGVYDRKKYRLGSYLETSFSDLQAMKKQHSLCGSCMRHGLHVVGVYGAPELDERPWRRIREHDPAANVFPIDLCAAPKQRRGMRKVAWLVKRGGARRTGTHGGLAALQHGRVSRAPFAFRWIRPVGFAGRAGPPILRPMIRVARFSSADRP